MSKDVKDGFENMRFYKFYPVKSPKYPDISSMQVRMPSFPPEVTRIVLKAELDGNSTD